jgi:protein SCO1
MKTSSITVFVATIGLALTNVSFAQDTWPSQSIYNLQAALVNQSGEQHGLDIHAGHPVLVTLFYSSCPAACPLLIDTVRAIEATVDHQRRQQLRVLLISLDPEHDTTAALATLAKERRIDLSRWTLAHTDAATVRRLAAVLNIQYRRLPDGQYNHASVISLLSTEGEILRRTSLLGRADGDMVAAIDTAADRSGGKDPR